MGRRPRPDRWRVVAPVLAAGLLASLGVSAEEPDGARVPDSRQEITLSFAPLVRQAAPAVVNIYARQAPKRAGRGPSSMFDDPFFRRFFGDAFPFPQQPQQREKSALGSGVIVRPDGVIVTNHHVIDGADEIKVVLADGRERAAEVVLTDDRTDLSVLRIDARGETLPTIALGQSDSLEVGDLVLAIGNPFGVGQTVTSGIVSALARTTEGIADYNFFIQTDAAINPGNSGGALVTMDGRLAGINTAIYAGRSGANVGIGFAIPADMVRTVVEAAVGSDHVVRPWIGVAGRDVNTDLADALGLDRPRGVLVEALHSRSPLARAGIRRGDVVAAVDGHEIRGVAGLRFRVATRRPGETVALSVLRDGKPLEMDVPLEAPPEQPPSAPELLRGPHPLDGAEVDSLSPALDDRFGFDMTLEGVVVRRLLRGSAAMRAGFRPRDVIERVNDVDVTEVRLLKAALADGSAGGYAIRVRRGDEVHKVWFDR